MNNAIKGALISGLIFPGLGQVALRHYKRGAVIIVTVFLILAAIITIGVRHALAILEKVEAAGGTANIGAIADTAAQVSADSTSLTINVLSILLFVCWLAGVADAYGIGRDKDRSEG